jgi:hypothetical protein
MSADLGAAAAALAGAGWRVHPLVGKQPLLPHGLKDASGDPATVAGWWERWPLANIGIVVPDSLVVLDFDPRAGAWQSLAELEAEHGPLPVTLTVRTGGADRGEHRYFLRPPGPVAMAKLGAGIDLRLPGRHYLVAPPSRHPETAREYQWLDVTAAPAPLPSWLAAMLRPPRPAPVTRAPLTGSGDRPGDTLAASVTWAQILAPCGWTSAGSRGEVGFWRRPGKVGGTISATTNALGTNRFHVFSSNAAPFDPDRSYSKFAALAMLEHGGDFAAAARALRREVAPV